MSKASKRQFLATVEGIDGAWATKSGGNRSAEVSLAYDGGNPEPDLISSPPKTENITLTRVYDPDRDDAMMHDMLRRVGALRRTVSVQPLTADYVATAKPTVYPKALLIAVHPPEVEASSGDPAELTLEFAVSRIS